MGSAPEIGSECAVGLLILCIRLIRYRFFCHLNLKAAFLERVVDGVAVFNFNIPVRRAPPPSNSPIRVTIQTSAEISAAALVQITI